VRKNTFGIGIWNLVLGIFFLNLNK